MESTTMASVTESLGRDRADETNKLVVVAEVPVALVKAKLVVVTLVEVKVVPMLERPETNKFVVVAPVPTTVSPPMIVVDTPVAPI